MGIPEELLSLGTQDHRTRVALEDAGCRGVGNGSCPPALRSGFFLGRGLAIAIGLSERIPRRALDGMPRRAFPR